MISISNTLNNGGICPHCLFTLHIDIINTKKGVNVLFKLISQFILWYYITYRFKEYRLKQINHNKCLQYIENLLLQEYQYRCPFFKSIYVENVTIFDDEFNNTPYLLNNDIDYNILCDYIYKHYHTISNCDIIISINIVPFDGIDIYHGDILNILDPLFL